MQDHPRFITKFQHAVVNHVDPENLGLSSLHWWPQVCDLHKCDNLTIPDIYQLYRNFVQHDMVQSTRIQQLGMCDYVHDMLFYCFRAGLVSPPPHTTDLLCKLHREDHSIVWDTDDEHNAVIKIHPWPSWLRRGTLRTVTSFFYFFYDQPPPTDDCTSRECRFCHDVIDGHWWAHILSPCLLQDACGRSTRATCVPTCRAGAGLGLKCAKPRIPPLQPT